MYVLVRLTLIATLLVAATTARAAFPEKPIELLDPYPAGGSGDQAARLIATELGTRLGANVFVTNSASAGGVVALTRVARARPDGYTLVFAGTDVFTINPLMFAKLDYKYSDFVPVGLVARTGILILVDPELPVRNLAELIAYAKANPGRLSWGSTGVGLTSHQICEYLKLTDAVDILHVPYNGAAAAAADLLGKRVNVIANTPSSTVQHIRKGAMRPLGITLPVRSPLLPEVPTFAEQNRGDVDFDVKYGIFAPATTPSEALGRLRAAVHAALASPAVVDSLKAIDVMPFWAAPEDTDKVIREEAEKKRNIIQRSGIKAQ